MNHKQDKSEALEEVTNWATAEIISSKTLWEDTASEILQKQVLFYRENTKLGRRARKIRAQILTDIYYVLNDASIKRRIDIYQSKVNSGKWANFRARFIQTDVDFDLTNSKWFKPKPEMVDLTGKTLEEMKLTVKNWKESESIVHNGKSTTDGLMEEWKLIKEELEKAFEECKYLSSDENKEKHSY